LRVLGEWGLGEGYGEVTRGQPMGSIFSFPLLCLINKTVVDLALTDLLEQGRISFPEWSGHRCLVNGDDLLLREVRKDTNIRDLIAENGRHIGLVVNLEKSMVSENLAEVNSTLFDSCEKIKKQNVSALWMDPEVDDVLGLAWEASTDVRGFVKIVRANAHILSKQPDKKLYAIPAHLQTACRRDKKNTISYNVAARRSAPCRRRRYSDG